MADGAGPLGATRARIRVRGLVQGVGFRPHVWRKATAAGFTGFTLNDSDGVLIEVQGEGADGFAEALSRDLPPLARIGALDWRPAPLGPETSFEIRASEDLGRQRASVPADSAPCAHCLHDMFDPANRRWRHAFISCTDCGPRHTITARLPYDRPHTSMAAFAMCGTCTGEYADPGDRRFHAEPIACPDCGPRLSAPVEDAFAALMAGQIVALKGVGGFQLCADARRPETVARLRALKERSAKPFAVMVAGLASARRLARLSPTDEAALTGPDRPIVLVPVLSDGGLADAVAPGLDLIGLMLPSSPLHYLLFHEAAGRPGGTDWIEAPQDLALIATSANPGGEPLCIDGADARRRLAGIADLVIDHDRAILIRADDPVVRVIDGAPVVLRRGRGQAPDPIALPFEAPPVLALGGFLKASVCVVRGREAVLSQHVGDLDDPATIAFHEETARHLLSIMDVAPQAVACDLHPDFPSTVLAGAFGAPVIRVQHHHAHAAGVLAEHGRTGPALALVLDGYGLGDDGGGWGGELLSLEGARCTRIGGLAPIPLPGGDRAAREPWRLAAAAMAMLGRGDEIARRFVDQPLAPALARLLAGGQAPLTSSAGRWFDAAAGLLGLCPVQGFEAEAAMRLEALAGDLPALGAQDLIAFDADGRLDPRPIFGALADCRDPAAGAALFHDALAAGLARLVRDASAVTGIGVVALSGGCLANARLSESILRELSGWGLEVVKPRRIPPGDGGLALGQAVVAAQSLLETR